MSDTSLKAITANRLDDGIAVWLTAEGGWTERFAEAQVADTPALQESQEAIAAEAVALCSVVDALPIDVVLEDGIAVPKKLKERIRALGPTVRLDLGKQAQQALQIEKAA